MYVYKIQSCLELETVQDENKTGHDFPLTFSCFVVGCDVFLATIYPGAIDDFVRTEVEGDKMGESLHRFHFLHSLLPIMEAILAGK